jgi:hypothetical protein
MLRMNRALPPLPHPPSWPAQKQYYLYTNMCQIVKRNFTKSESLFTNVCMFILQSDWLRMDSVFDSWPGWWDFYLIYIRTGSGVSSIQEVHVALSSGTESH